MWNFLPAKINVSRVPETGGLTDCKHESRISEEVYIMSYTVFTTSRKAHVLSMYLAIDETATKAARWLKNNWHGRLDGCLVKLVIKPLSSIACTLILNMLSVWVEQ